MSQENVEIVRRVMDLFERGEVSSIFEQQLCTPDAELRPAFEVPGAEIYVGVDGLTEFMRIWTEDFDSWEFHTERVIDAGDNKVAVLAGQMAVGKASRAPVETFMGMVHTLEDSKVKKVQIWVDPEDALKAAGLSEQDAQADS